MRKFETCRDNETEHVEHESQFNEPQAAMGVDGWAARETAIKFATTNILLFLAEFDQTLMTRFKFVHSTGVQSNEN